MKQLLLALPRGEDYLNRAWMETEGTAAVRTALDGGGCVCTYGPEGSGKSLLLAMVKQEQPEWLVVDGLEDLNKAAQELLFHEFNARGGKKILVASRVPVAQLELLPDLKSRLLTGIQVEITLPTDVELKAMMGKAAAARQLTLPDNVVDFLVLRAERNPKVLAEILDKLDVLSLEEKRAVTVPLVKKVLA